VLILLMVEDRTMTSTLAHTSNGDFDPLTVLRDLLSEIGLGIGDAGGSVRFSGADPIFESRLRLAAGIGIPIMACAVGAARIWKMRTGEAQDLDLDLRRAIHQINPHVAWHPTLNGLGYANATAFDNPFLILPFKTRDGRMIMATGVYPHMAAKWLRLLNCPPDWEKVVAAIVRWDAAELEEAGNAQGLAAAYARTPQEWARHPQGALLARTPVIEIEKIADGDPQPFGPADRPLSDVRVLSFTHAIAGPTVGRTLAEQGADVLCATFPNHLEHEFIYNEANIGSRSTTLDLTIEEHRARVEELLADTDVVVDNHRPGRMASFGLEPSQLADRHPGIVSVSVSAYGHDGPWAERAGHDQNAAAASGLMAIEGAGGDPRLPPTGLINDFLTGYMGAAGATAALIRRATEGGSYRVKASLTRTAMFVTSLGQVDPQLAGSSDEHSLREPDGVRSDTPLGQLVALAPPVVFSQTPPRWPDPLLVPRGSSTPAWLERHVRP
jgi:CoA-transferase family III